MIALRASPGPMSLADLDLAHLRTQAPDLSGDPLRFFETQGLRRGLDPTPWFSTDWYGWQNPDWKDFPNPYAHYLAKGRREGRDPSPFVDMRRFLDQTEAAPPEAYDMIRAGWRSPALGIYETRADLTRLQQMFRDAISVSAPRITPPVTPRRALVVLQAGRGLPHLPWRDSTPRNWDLMVNYYDAAGAMPDLGEYVLFQKGTKFTAMAHLWQAHRAILQRYDHVLFLDDDVETTIADLNRLFDTCRQYDLDLAQMSLTKRSFCNWQALYRQGEASEPRPVSAVEIMMPVFSRAALAQAAASFERSVSGFGLDLAWGKIIGDWGGRIAVLDSVAATHARPVDSAGGAYYSYLRRHMINPKSELWLLLQDYDADRNLSSA